MTETLCTTAQALLAIGKNASAAQIAAANTTIWINMAESDMEKAFGKLGSSPELVANYASITASYKQWLAMICSHRAAFYAINQDQQAWALSVTQSKLNVCDSVWTGFLADLKGDSSEIVARMGL